MPYFRSKRFASSTLGWRRSFRRRSRVSRRRALPAGRPLRERLLGRAGKPRCLLTRVMTASAGQNSSRAFSSVLGDVAGRVDADRQLGLPELPRASAEELGERGESRGGAHRLSRASARTRSARRGSPIAGSRRRRPRRGTGRIRCAARLLVVERRPGRALPGDGPALDQFGEEVGLLLEQAARSRPGRNRTAGTSRCSSPGPG